MGNTARVYDVSYNNRNNSILRLCKSSINTSDIFEPQTNGEISQSIMQNWTTQAIECYEINSDCSRCSLNGGCYSFVCQMPKIVNALLKTYGPPKETIDENSTL